MSNIENWKTITSEKEALNQLRKIKDASNKFEKEANISFDKLLTQDLDDAILGAQERKSPYVLIEIKPEHIATDAFHNLKKELSSKGYECGHYGSIPDEETNVVYICPK